MIKELLEQLAPLDAQIAALRGGAQDEESQMTAITAHASELAELAVEEDEILRCCGPLTAEDRVFLARHPERPHIDETINALFTDFFEQCGDRQCREDSAILGGIARFHGMPVTVIGHRKGSTLEENMACNFGMPGPEGYRGLLILFSILSSSLLQIFGTLALLLLFIFVLSFVALGFNIVPSENYIDDITTQKCLDGDTENLPEQDINDHQSDERMAQIEKTLETWAASGGFKDPTVTLGTLSQQLHIMRSDLTYYFEKHIKLTFRVWLSDIRFHEVQRMLKKYPEYNNDAISMECGFSSRAHLYRIFKQKTGMTPGEWKLSLKDKESDN